MPEYSAFEEQAKKLEKTVEQLGRKGKEILQDMRDLQDEMRAYQEIENHYLTPPEMKDRMRKGQEKRRKQIDELIEDMEAVGAASATVIAHIAHLRQQDAKWDAVLRDEQKSKNFPQA